MRENAATYNTLASVGAFSGRIEMSSPLLFSICDFRFTIYNSAFGN